MFAKLTGLFKSLRRKPDELSAAANVIRAIVGFSRNVHDIERILYLAQAIHLGRHGVTIFPDLFHATNMGPAIPDFKDRVAFDRRRSDPYDAELLTVTARQTLREVAGHCKAMKSLELLRLMQDENGAWARYFAGGDFDPVIPNKALLEEYEALAA